MRPTLLIFLCLVCLKAFSNGSLESKVQSLIDAVDPYCDVGIEIQTMEGKSIFSRNAQRSYPTASTQKVVSGVGALMASKKPDLFQGVPKNFAAKPFVTTLYYDCAQKKSYLVLGGDPLLRTQDLKLFFEEAKTKGLLGQKLVVVLSKKSSNDLSSFSPGIPYESLDFCYGAALTPHVVDANEIAFQLSGQSSNGQASIEPEGVASLFPIRNDTFVQDTCFPKEEVGDFDQIQRRALSFDGKEIYVTGCIPRMANFKMCLPVPLENLPAYLKKVIQNCVSIPVEIAQKEPKNLKTLKQIQYTSSSLRKLLEVSLKDSNNLVADALFEKTTQAKELPRNWKFAGLVLKKHLQDFLDFSFEEGDDIESGSGLSLYNRLSPLTMTRLLQKTYEKFGEEFAALLAEGGVDGTLKNRFKDLSCGKVRAKTGTLRGVTALAGYVYGKAETPIVITIFVTGTSSKQKEHRQLIDSIVKELILTI
jgi:D-alanyl-D-alanine carboxypeptidase/D-alanyl-D-alanine-endopeptidase (penicillin-binding protein 4)